MQRKPDWPKHFMSELQAAAERPFVWGEHDCAMFACNMVRAMTDSDPGEMFRGFYHTQLGAQRFIDSYGGIAPLAEYVMHDMDCQEVRPAMAHRGDVCVVDLGDRGQALGICAGERVVVASTVGLAFLPMANVTRAWATGR